MAHLMLKHGLRNLCNEARSSPGFRGLSNAAAPSWGTRQQRRWYTPSKTPLLQPYQQDHMVQSPDPSVLLTGLQAMEEHAKTEEGRAFLQEVLLGGEEAEEAAETSQPQYPTWFDPTTEERKLDYTDAATYSATTRAPHEAFTMHPSCYTSEEFYKVEEKRVFGKSWVCVGMVDNLRQPGDTIVAEVAGQPIFITKDKKGQVNGFLNVCRHRGSKLVRQNGRNAVISCPYHRWGYALDGRLLATPLWDTTEGGLRFDKETGEKKTRKLKGKKAREAAAKEAAEAIECAEKQAEANAPCDQVKGVMAAFDTAHIKAFDKKDFALFKVRVETWGPFVFATIGEENEVPPLHEALGDLPQVLERHPLDELVSVRSKSYESKCNWKLLAENFMEYYHLPTVHPELTLVSTVDNHHRLQGPGQYVGFITKPLSRGGTAIDPDVFPPMPGIAEADKDTAFFHHLFPNAFYFMLPSHVFTVRLEPKGPNLTIEHADLLVHPSLLDDANVKQETEALNEKIDSMMAFYELTNDQDIEASQLVQEGIQATRYEGGRVSYRFEETIHRFQNMLIDHMAGFYGRVPQGDQTIPFYIGGQPDHLAAPSLANPRSTPQ